jgi:hypothetical protein
MADMGSLIGGIYYHYCHGTHSALCVWNNKTLPEFKLLFRIRLGHSYTIRRKGHVRLLMFLNALYRISRVAEWPYTRYNHINQLIESLYHLMRMLGSQKSRAYPKGHWAVPATWRYQVHPFKHKHVVGRSCGRLGWPRHSTLPIV